MTKKGNIYLRIDDRTQVAMNLIASELGNETGRKLSANAALWGFIEKCRSDIAERAAELVKQQKKNSKKE